MDIMLYPIALFAGDGADLVIGFIDANGNVKVTPRFAGAGHFCEGKASVADVSGRSGFLDLRGDLAIPMLFRGVSHFHDGVCAIGAERGVGYIDHAGNWHIEPRFLIAMDFAEGRAFVSDDGETFYMITLKGARVGKDCFDRARAFRAGLAPVMKDGRWGFIDDQGTVAIPFAFEDTQAQHFKSGYASVKVGGRWDSSTA